MTSLPIASATALWFLTRGTGVVTLLLLTLVLVLGVLNVQRTSPEGIPRFVTQQVHRNASLLAVVFLILHIVTTVLDPFAPISLLDAVLPFHSAYRPIWLGLGAIASDLLFALAITSLLRRSLGYGPWRAIHWLAYAAWPVAIVHGLGTGSDTRAVWMLVLTAGCVLAALVAVLVRVASASSSRTGPRLAAFAGAVLFPLGLLAWLPGGPLARDWARRAGTPATVLLKAGQSKHVTVSREIASSFRASFSGSVQERDEGGSRTVSLLLELAHQPLSLLRVVIQGQSLPGGGVSMTSSDVALGTSAQPDLFEGRVTALGGTTIQASVSDHGSQSMTLVLHVELKQGSGRATGTLTAER